MKVFISHKKEDSSIALEVLQNLKKYNIDAYLDLLEGDLPTNGEKLTNHVRKRLNECTDILVVISDKTKYSWWVPFEVGMATQKDFPIVNYLPKGIQLPLFLEYWPRLKDADDLAKYVSTRITVEKSLQEGGMFGSPTDAFYKRLKAIL